MNIWELFVRGGLVMWPILLCSLAAVAIFVERWRFYNKKKCTLDAELLGNLEGKTLTGAERRELLQSRGNLIVTDLHDYLQYLEGIVTISPLLGLLGTVSGMISSFNILSITEGQPFAITGGVSEALIATAFGLLVAIVSLVLHVILVQRENKLIQRMEELCDSYLQSTIGGEA